MPMGISETGSWIRRNAGKDTEGRQALPQIAVPPAAASACWYVAASAQRQSTQAQEHGVKFSKYCFNFLSAIIIDLNVDLYILNPWTDNF